MCLTYVQGMELLLLQQQSRFHSSSVRKVSQSASLQDLAAQRPAKQDAVSAVWQKSFLDGFEGLGPMKLDKKTKAPEIIVKLIEDQSKTLDRVEKMISAILSVG